jgi:integrase
MLAAAGSTLRDLRNKALLTVAYTTLCRRSELVALQRADLETEADGFGTVTIRRSKTDQEGAGEVAPITPDAMRHVTAWLQLSSINSPDRDPAATRRRVTTAGLTGRRGAPRRVGFTP